MVLMPCLFMSTLSPVLRVLPKKIKKELFSADSIKASLVSRLLIDIAILYLGSVFSISGLAL